MATQPQVENGQKMQRNLKKSSLGEIKFYFYRKIQTNFFGIESIFRFREKSYATSMTRQRTTTFFQ